MSRFSSILLSYIYKSINNLCNVFILLCPLLRLFIMYHIFIFKSLVELLQVINSLIINLLIVNYKSKIRHLKTFIRLPSLS
jgi:hypothetical protein